MSPAPTNAMVTRQPGAKTGISDPCPNAPWRILVPAGGRDPFQIQQPQHDDPA
jgi:hypothetical protein